MKSTTLHYISVDCDRCEVRVHAEVRGECTTKYFDTNVMVHLPEDCFSLVVCPSCKQVILARQEWQGEDDYGGSIWSKPVRVWPHPDRETNSLVPEIVRVSLEEARRCHRATAYTATAVMCGRALEGVCVHFETKNQTLSKGLKELREREIIDDHLALWGDQLRQHRNLAAHATDEKTSREDATDLLDFVNAICEYVFVLRQKYQSFMARKKKGTHTPDGEAAASSAES